MAAGRVSEWFVRLWWMITPRVECLNGLFSVVSTSWHPLEGMGAEEAAFGPVIPVGGRGQKSRPLLWMLARRVECPFSVVSSGLAALGRYGSGGGRRKNSCQLGGLRSVRSRAKRTGDTGRLHDQLPLPCYCFNSVPCLLCSCLPFHPACP